MGLIRTGISRTAGGFDPCQATMAQDKPPYRIAYCMPVPKPSVDGDGSFLQQTMIMNGLKARGHDLTFLGLHNLSEVVCMANDSDRRFVERTWSKRCWINLAGKLTWHIQKRARIPSVPSWA